MTSDDYETIAGNVFRPPSQDARVDAYLVVVAGIDIGKIYPVQGTAVIIGRGADCTIVCDSPLASRLHARLEIRDGETWIVDLGSTNGTLVNFEPIKEKQLVDGDKIAIGETVLKYLAADTIDKTFHDEVYKLTSRDPLTQAYNRLFLEEMLVREFQRARRAHGKLSLCMMDLDYFKEVNDRFGHPAGDGVLRGLSELVQQIIRQEDIFARYGGEEFCLLLPGRSRKKALAIAERIRKSVERHVFQQDGELIRITVSIGVCSLSESITVAEEMIREADRMLYRSKESGRNRVTG
ncbi:MAG: diguanylate cyclase [Acidobacteria bacterium]|nr:diguanylate cyclase [Acidobacteriota bacterium]